MNKHSFKDWLFAVRPWSFPASSMPALLSFVYVSSIPDHLTVTINWFFGVLAIIGAVIFHSGGNLISDYFDYKQGVDREDTFGAQMLVNNVFEPKTILYYAICFILAGIGLGIYLTINTGLPLLAIGIVGLTGAIFYYQFKTRALGDLLIFLIYGPVISLGTYYAMTSSLDWKAVVLSFPVTFITVDILHANNTRDIIHDKRAGISTLAMKLGVKHSILLYKLLIYMSYVFAIILVIARIISWITLIVFITLPLAVKNMKMMSNVSIENLSCISDLDVRTAQLQLGFSLLMILSIFISAWF